MRRPRTTVILLLSGALLTLAGLGPVASPAWAEGDAAQMVLVLDSSGSMKEKAADGKTKITAAKTALNGVVDTLPDSAQVGMRVYGATVFDRSDKGACQDTQLVVPIGSDNRDELTKEIKKYKPYGETPIAYSLKQAAKDLGTKGQRTIVLVSDGEETCVPDPCPVAEQIAAQGIDLKIDVVGFGVKGKAESQLKCVAEEGNGTYYSADDTEELEESLSTLSTRAFRPFEYSGDPVTGSTDPTDAPEISDGAWVDELDSTGELKNYRVTRKQPGSTLWIGLTSRPTQKGAMAMRVKTSPVEDPGSVCERGFGFNYDTNGGKPLNTAMVSSDAGDDDACSEADELIVSLEVSDNTTITPGTPVQLTVTEEAPVSDRDSLPEAAEKASWAKMAPKNPQQIVPGTSLASAPLVKDGSYAVTAKPGEIQLLKVKADWGQQVQGLVQLRALSKAEQKQLDSLRWMNVKVLSPLGAETHGPRTEGPSGVYPRVGIKDNGTSVAASTVPITYRNREARQQYLQNSALVGEYYVAFQVEASSKADNDLALPLTVTVGAVGEVEGAPTYDAPGSSTSPSPDAGDQETPAPTPEQSGTETPGPSASASNDATPEPGNQGSDQPTAQVEETDRPWGLIGGLAAGAVALGGLGTGGVLWLRRRG